MKSLRVFCTSLCITLLPTLTCQAYAEDESVGAIFLNEAVGTRPTAMGEAYVAVPGDLNSIYWNSAGLIHSPNVELLIVHTEFIQSFRNEYFAFSLPISSTDALGVNTYFSYNNSLEKTTSLYADTSSFSAYDAYMGISWSRAWDNQFSSGLNVKGIYQSIDIYSAWSLALDACGLARNLLLPDLVLGLTIKNLGLPMKFIDKGFDLPLTFEIGSAYTLLNKQLLLSFDISKPLAQELLFKLGLEFNLEEVLFFRAGYKYYQFGNDLGPLSGLTCGIGAEITEYKVDYTFAPYTDLGNIHRISITFPFSRSTVEEVKIIQRLEKKLEAKQQKLVRDQIQKGDTLNQKGEFKKAIVYYEKALALYPHFPELAQKLYQTREKLQTRTAENHYQLGVQAYKEKSYMTALIELNKVSEINNTYKSIQKYLALVNEKLSELQADKTATEMTRKIQELFQQGLQHLKNREYRTAINFWKKILSLDPANTRTKKHIENARTKMQEESEKLLSEARMYETGSGNLITAIVLWKKVLHMDPENKAAKMELAKYQEYIAQASEEIYKKGLQNYVQNNLGEAIENWENVLVLDPDNIRAEKNLKRAKEKLEYIKALEKNNK